MANIRLTAFTEKAVLALTDFFYIHDTTSGEERKGLLSSLKTLILNGKTVGGTSAGDIANIDSAQTFTNKRLNSPGINSATAVTTTSAELNRLVGLTADAAELNKLDGATVTTAEINKLAGATVSTAEINRITGLTAEAAELNILDGATLTTVELNRLTGVTGNVQTQITALDARIPALTQVTHTYGTGTISSTATQIITESALRTDAGGGTGTRVDPDTIDITVYMLSAGSWYEIPAADGVAGARSFSTTVTSGSTVLNQIEVKLDNTEDYKIVVQFKLLALSGA